MKAIEKYFSLLVAFCSSVVYKNKLGILYTLGTLVSEMVN